MLQVIVCCLLRAPAQPQHPGDVLPGQQGRVRAAPTVPSSPISVGQGLTLRLRKSRGFFSSCSAEALLLRSSSRVRASSSVTALSCPSSRRYARSKGSCPPPPLGSGSPAGCGPSGTCCQRSSGPWVQGGGLEWEPGAEIPANTPRWAHGGPTGSLSPPTLAAPLLPPLPQAVGRSHPLTGRWTWRTGSCSRSPGSSRMKGSA